MDIYEIATLREEFEELVKKIKTFETQHEGTDATFKTDNLSKISQLVHVAAMELGWRS